jgi:hypothetical protein
MICEFQNTSYPQPYDPPRRKLMQENLYTAASIITSPATAARNGRFTEVSELTGLKNFVTTFDLRRLHRGGGGEMNAAEIP